MVLPATRRQQRERGKSWPKIKKKSLQEVLDTQLTNTFILVRSGLCPAQQLISLQVQNQNGPHFAMHK